MTDKSTDKSSDIVAELDEWIRYFDGRGRKHFPQRARDEIVALRREHAEIIEHARQPNKSWIAATRAEALEEAAREADLFGDGMVGHAIRALKDRPG